jgi:hypothetical protein
MGVLKYLILIYQLKIKDYTAKNMQVLQWFLLVS